MANLEVLVPMTDKAYELTIANADGSFEFLDSYEDINTAVNAANNIPKSSLEESQQPAVINSVGQVVYSTNQMARILKYVNNSNITGNVDVYSDSSLTNSITYVNQGYMDDAPILDMTSTSAKVMINGVIGWINNDKASGTYDMRVVPLNQANNPSYYTVRNGELIHFISYDLEGTTGYEKILGKAPSILKEGVRYLSYDGQYFYEYNHTSQTSITNALNILIEDYKSGVRTNSINNGNPYYIYYLNLPFRSQTVYSAEDLNRFINNHDRIGTTSKLYNLGQAFKDAETQYGVNAVIALAVAINESNFGNSQIAQSKNNLFGLKAYDSAPGESASTFATPKDSVIDFTKNYISRGYSDPADWRYNGGFLGNKNKGANVRYASDPFWGEKAASFAYEIDKYLSGGNSNLKDTNSKQIGMATANNSVINRNGTLLYNVSNDTNKYDAYIYTPFVVSDLQQVTINGSKYYEIYPERNTAVGLGGLSNKYHGNYDWNDKGYILANNISLINVFTPPVEKKY
ncbi:MAG: glucosaminidase domain-containing protein, partial [Clostridium sp.]